MSNPYCKEDPLAEYKKYRFTWRDLSFLRHKCDFLLFLTFYDQRDD